MKGKYSTRLIKLLFFTTRYFVVGLICTSSYGQIIDNFGDGNLQNPTWFGDTSNWIVNTDGQLQLKAATAGTSKIYSKFKKPLDSIELNFYFKMQFAPSSDNNVIIYLLMDAPDESSGSGFYLTIGENGSSDAIKLWNAASGVSTLLATGSMGEMGGDPSDVRLKAKILTNGSWEITTDYSGGLNFAEDISIVNNISSLPDSLFFGLSAKYTSSRVDKFFLDDLSIKTVERDLKPPKITAIKVIDDRTLLVSFDEIIILPSATLASNYSVDNVGAPVSVLLNGMQSVIVTYTNALQSGIEYILTASNIKDKSGNAGTSSWPFSFATKAAKGDLIINELLSDPYSGGEDFIEIYNRSAKTIQLQGLIIKNITKNESKPILSDAIIQPGTYLAISKNIDFLKTTYKTPPSAAFLQETLPSMNVSDAYMGLVQDGIMIDSFRYEETMHFELIDETKGVSMERITLQGPSNNPNNWHSASSTVLYATPGYENSQYESITGDTDPFTITTDRKVITPDGDGDNDFVNILYKLEKSGYLATIKVYDPEGFPLFDIGNNVLLGQEGTLKWDGLTPEGERLRMGIYVLYTRLFHVDGDIKEFKNVVAIADRN